MDKKSLLQASLTSNTLTDQHHTNLFQIDPRQAVDMTRVYDYLFCMDFAPVVVSQPQLCLPEGIKAVVYSDKKDRCMICFNTTDTNTMISLLDRLLRSNVLVDDVISIHVDDISDIATNNNCVAYYTIASLLAGVLKVKLANIFLVDGIIMKTSKFTQGVSLSNDQGKIATLMIGTQKNGSEEGAIDSFSDRVVEVLAHELRHVWQHTYHEGIYLSNYQGFRDGDNEQDYKMYLTQEAELDAMAFSLAVCHKLFNWGYCSTHLSPYSEVNTEIRKRAKKIRLETPEIGNLPEFY